jgi:hypothetical protein
VKTRSGENFEGGSGGHSGVLEVYRLVPGPASSPKSEFSAEQMRVFWGLESGRDVEM